MIQHKSFVFANLLAWLLCAAPVHAGAPSPDAQATDDPKLPRLLVIGDSISMNYHEAAKSALAGVANYHRNEGNAASSAEGVRKMELWLGNYREKGFHWDVIQLNHGLHDLKQSYDAQTDTWGDYSVSPADYKANLEKEIALLRRTGAKPNQSKPNRYPCKPSSNRPFVSPPHSWLQTQNPSKSMSSPASPT